MLENWELNAKLAKHNKNVTQSTISILLAGVTTGAYGINRWKVELGGNADSIDGDQDIWPSKGRQLLLIVQKRKFTSK